MSIISCAADQTRLPSLHSEELILNNDARIELRLLHFVLNGKAVNDWTTNSVAQLNHVEGCSAYRATICALDPRLEAGIVEVVLARQKMGYRLFVGMNTAMTS